MKQTISMFIDLIEEPIGCLLLTLHSGDKPLIHIHGNNFPVTIQLTLNQAFHLMVELQSLFRKVSLPLKE